MAIKKLFLIIVGLILFLSQNYAASINLKEIEILLKNGKYSIVLEKSLNILNTREGELTPVEAGELHYYIGFAYKKNGNKEMAVSYLKEIEQKYRMSEYLRLSYMELADIYKDDYYKWQANLEKVYDNYPQTPEAISAGIELSKKYVNLKNFRKAIPVLENLLNLWKVGNLYPELNMLLALSYSGINDYIDAIDYLRIAEKKIAKTINTNPLYIFEAGKICYNNQNFKKAITYLSKLVNVYPGYKGNFEAAIILAESYQRGKNLFMSAVFLIKAIEKNPIQKKKKYGLLLNLGNVLGQLNDEDLAKIRKNYPLYSDAKKLLTIVKKNSPVYEQKRSATILLSGEFRKTDDFAKIIDNYYRFLRKKRDPLVQKFFQQSLDQYIDDLHRKKDYNQILKFWFIIKPRKSYLSATNLLKLGEILFEVKLYLNAEDVYNHMQKYSIFSKEWPTVRRQLVRLYFIMGKYEEYIKIFSKLNLEGEREKGEFLFYNLQSHIHLGKEEELKNLLKEITSQEIRGAFQFKILEMEADQLKKEKKYNTALNLYKDLEDHIGIDDPQLLGILLKIGDIYYKTKNWDSSLSYYIKAEKLQENDEWILFRKISIFKNTDCLKEVRKTLMKLKKINPDSFWIQQAEKNVR